MMAENYSVLIEIAESLDRWLTETAEKFNIDKNDLQSVIKQLLS